MSYALSKMLALSLALDLKVMVLFSAYTDRERPFKINYHLKYSICKNR